MSNQIYHHMEINIKEVASRKGLNLKDICYKCGYKSLPSFYRQINSPETLSMRTLIKIANVIGCEVNDFFSTPQNTAKVICPKCGKEIVVELKSWFCIHYINKTNPTPSECQKTIYNGKFWGNFGFLYWYVPPFPGKCRTWCFSVSSFSFPWVETPHTMPFVCVVLRYLILGGILAHPDHFTLSNRIFRGQPFRWGLMISSTHLWRWLPMVTKLFYISDFWKARQKIFGGLSLRIDLFFGFRGGTRGVSKVSSENQVRGWKGWFFRGVVFRK